MVLHLLLGDDPLFHVAGYHLVHPVEFVAYIVLGAVGGLCSVGFVKLLLGLRQRFMRLPKWTVWLQPAVGGLTVGIMALFVPDVLGVGYGMVEKVLAGGVLLKVVVVLGILKIIATAVCYASGNAGGIFGPSLFIGAMIGAAVGSVAQVVFPGHTAGPGAYALVGMGAAFAGIIRTPLTSVIMIFEVTRDYAIIVPLMLSNLIAFFISYKLQPEPIYEALAHQDGIHLPAGASREQSGKSRVAAAMRSVPRPLTLDLPIGQAAVILGRAGVPALPVVDEEGLCAMVGTDDLNDAMAEEGGVQRPLSTLIDRHAVHRYSSAEEFPHLHPDHTLALALERMGTSRKSVLPVVSRANVRQLIGIVTVGDVLKVYGLADRPASSNLHERLDASTKFDVN
jgi:CIC family chloride channel protein